MAVVFCTVDQALTKAGANHHTYFDSGGGTTDVEEFINQAESFINVSTRINYSDTYSTLNTDVKRILEDAASSHAAMAIINYDMGSYNTLAEAQTMLDLNYTRLKDAMRLLDEKKHTNFIDDA